MQRYGTEECRGCYGDNVWCRVLGAWLRTWNERWGLRRFVVTDVRFPNEADWIREHGGLVVKLYGRGRKLTAEQRAHPSEAGVDAITPDLAIDNSPENSVEAVNELLDTVKGWMTVEELTERPPQAVQEQMAALPNGLRREVI